MRGANDYVEVIPDLEVFIWFRLVVRLDCLRGLLTALDCGVTSWNLQLTCSEIVGMRQHPVPALGSVSDRILTYDTPFRLIEETSLACRLLHCCRSSLTPYELTFFLVKDALRMTYVSVAQYDAFELQLKLLDLFSTVIHDMHICEYVCAADPYLAMQTSSDEYSIKSMMCSGFV